MVFGVMPLFTFPVMLVVVTIVSVDCVIGCVVVVDGCCVVVIVDDVVDYN